MIESSRKLVKDFGRKYDKGTVLFKEGDPGKELYIIDSGSVKISKDIDGREQLLALLEEGDFFGEMVLFSENARTATATVMEEAVIVVITEELFNEYVKKDAHILYLLLEKVCHRLKETTDALVSSKS